MTSKKGLHVIVPTLGEILSNQTTLGVIFARIIKEFAQIFGDFAKVFTDFARILTKSKLLGVRFQPASCTTGREYLE